MRKIYIFKILSGLLLLLNSCSMDKLDLPDKGNSSGYNKETGEIYVNLQAADVHANMEIVSKGTSTDPQLDINHFAIDVLKSENTIIRHWDTYAEVNEQKIRLNAGNYTLRASYGSASASGFDAIYYKGEQPFTVVGQQNQGVEVTCKLANVKVAVVFGGQMQADYPDYRIEIQSGNSAPVSFGKNETRAAYFPAGKLKLKIYLTDHTGVTRSYKPAPVSGTAQDFITFKLDTKNTSGNLGLTITTDTSVEEKEENITLPSFMLPKTPPTISTEELGANGTLTYVEGEQKNLRVNFRADGSLRGCIFTVNSPELLAKGWPQQIDLANLTDEDLPKIEQMKKDGLKWFEDMNSSVLSYIDFSDLAKNLTAADKTTDYSFSLRLSDAFSQESETSTYTLSVEKPEFTLSPIAEGDVWATQALISAELAKGNPNLLKLQYKTNSTGWTDCATADRQSVGNAIALTAKSLPTTPSGGVTVTLRLKYNNHYSEERTVTTEASPQIPNSDFETYCEYKYNSKNDINSYFWYASQSAADKWWATRNPASSSQQKGSSAGGKNQYTRNNGSTPVDNGSNGKAVQIQTTAWGRGNTSYAWGPGTQYNTSAGLLFIGDYIPGNLQESSEALLPGKGIMLSETINQGHAFASRPAKFEFQYKYGPVNNESFVAYAVIQNRNGETVTELGRAEVAPEVAQTAVGTLTYTGKDGYYYVDGEMQHISLPFVYDERYKQMKATHICIFFSSSTKMGWLDGSDRPSAPNNGNTTGGIMSGSTLVIDNLNLNYNF